MSHQVATTILNQLGGHKFIAMTGAKHIVSLGEAIQFRLPSRFAKDGINLVVIKLNVMDTYDMEFMRIHGSSLKTISKSDGVYADMLQSEFTRHTGLDTHL